MTTDDLFSAKAAAKAANAPPDSLLPNPKGRLREQFHEVARFKHLSPRSEQADLLASLPGGAAAPPYHANGSMSF